MFVKKNHQAWYENKSVLHFWQEKAQVKSGMWVLQIKISVNYMNDLEMNGIH